MSHMCAQEACETHGIEIDECCPCCLDWLEPLPDDEGRL